MSFINCCLTYNCNTCYRTYFGFKKLVRNKAMVRCELSTSVIELFKIVNWESSLFQEKTDIEITTVKHILKNDFIFFTILGG